MAMEQEIIGGYENESLDMLPSALLATIFTKLDFSSICFYASTCKTFNKCDVAPSLDLLRPPFLPNIV
ncbi:hypothetical protein G4B88_006365 [Cannabis sativa]|uniref:F-box domain-containing protein n=1 Tax=Cannabis sativa TaxID=3483 RepID=A0A7J6ID47_CANSA|nr:hypothetical protein G4B88_006365 [Cannabis sativa]